MWLVQEAARKTLDCGASLLHLCSLADVDGNNAFLNFHLLLHIAILDTDFLWSITYNVN